MSAQPEFFNRELSWLKFNERVLHLADDERTPLLERVRFLGIFTSNLDEFYMKRVGGLKRQILAGISSLSIDGMTAAQQLAEIRNTVDVLNRHQARCFTESIRPLLSDHGIHLVPWEELSPPQRAFCRDYFVKNVFPVVTPFAVDPGHPFPFISNLSLSLGVKLAHRDQDEKLFARVKVPDVFPRWLRLDVPPQAGAYLFVSLLEVISHCLDLLFPGMEILSVTPFRVTRNADVEVDDDDAEDLLELIENELRQRKFARIVRLEHGPSPDPWVIQLLMNELELGDLDVCELPAELDYRGLAPIVDLPLPDLRYPLWTPQVPATLANPELDVFSAIRSRDLLVHHPYESFSASVEKFISSAADDPKVLAIKITLYRIGERQPLMNSLMRAAELGKHVVCLVELKARFDEQRNIFWAQQLEKSGVHVVYGVMGLKTHCKLTLVVRQESDGLRCYGHAGTGNYNAQTARLYTDLGLFTARPTITAELVDLFHYLTGRSLKGDYHHLLVAPMTMRNRFMELINQEVAHHKAGRPAGIIAKMNSLEDRKIIRALYAASQDGVPIRLIVRGFCCLRPGVPGLSENIRVVSVIGRFLEHSRVFYFRNGANDEIDGRFFIGSADWMYRNLSYRVEAVVPIDDLTSRRKIWELLTVLLADPCQAWDLQPDGRYTQRHPGGEADHPTTSAHARLMELARQRAHAPPLETQPSGSHSSQTPQPPGDAPKSGPPKTSAPQNSQAELDALTADLESTIDQMWENPRRKKQPYGR